VIFRRTNSLHPPKPRKPLRREGKVTGTVRLTGIEKSALREQAYLRTNGHCEDCGVYAPWKSGDLWSGHMAHIQGVGAGGSDVETNVLWLCAACHGKRHNAGGKPCPAKP
jgi:hypothetical protein